MPETMRRSQTDALEKSYTPVLVPNKALADCLLGANLDLIVGDVRYTISRLSHVDVDFGTETRSHSMIEKLADWIAKPKNIVSLAIGAQICAFVSLFLLSIPSILQSVQAAVGLSNDGLSAMAAFIAFEAGSAILLVAARVAWKVANPQYMLTPTTRR